MVKTMEKAAVFLTLAEIETSTSFELQWWNENLRVLRKPSSWQNVGKTKEMEPYLSTFMGT